MWTAHCLDYDIVTQGESPIDAMEMAREAVSMCLLDDLNHGDCIDREPAPPEYFERRDRILDKGQKIEALHPPTEIGSSAAQYLVFLELIFEKHEFVQSAPPLTFAHAMAA